MDDGPKLWDILRDRVPIENVARRFARDGHIRKSSDGWMCRCVCGGHVDRKPSVKVWREGHAHCFSCGHHFTDVIALYQCGAKLTKRWEACQQMRDDYLGSGFDMTAMTTGLRASAEAMSRAPALTGETPDWARILLVITLAHYQSLLSKSSEVLAYLRETRGLTDDTIRRMRIGYAGESGLKLALFRSRTLSDWGGKTVLSRASDLGLITEHGEFMRQRIIFPVLNDEGQPLFLVGRSTQAWQADTKYLNMPNSDYVVRKPMVWGRGGKETIVVEGPMDAAALLQWGLDSNYQVVCLLGIGFDEVLLVLTQQKNKSVILALDQDNAGKAAALKHVVALKEQGITCRVMVDRDRHDAARRCVKEMDGAPYNSLSDEQVIELEKASQHVLLVRNLRTQGVVTGVNWCSAKDHAEMLAWGDGRGRFEEGLL